MSPTDKERSFKVTTFPTLSTASPMTNPLDFTLHFHPALGHPWVINERIFDVLQTYLRACFKLSATHAANEINELFPSIHPPEGDKPNERPGGFLRKMWETVVDGGGRNFPGRVSLKNGY